MKLLVVAFLVVASILVANADEEPSSKDLLLKIGVVGPESLLPRVVTKDELANPKKGFLFTWTKIEYGGQTYWVAVCHLGDGVAYKLIGVYAPAEDGRYHRCLFAESWIAGSLKAKVNRQNGILELREYANSKLKGQVILSCNLKSIGTQASATRKMKH